MKKLRIRHKRLRISFHLRLKTYNNTVPHYTFNMLASQVPSFKIQAINSFFWILVHMIAIHHCAKEQLAHLNGAQMLTPYWPVAMLVSEQVLFSL